MYTVHEKHCKMMGMMNEKIKKNPFIERYLNYRSVHPHHTQLLLRKKHHFTMDSLYGT